MTEQDQNEIRAAMPAMPESAPDLLKERKWFGTDTRGLLLDFTKPYRPPRWTLSHNGIPFAKLGDLHIVGGKAGHGKTAFFSQIIAAILCGKFGGMSFELKDVGKPPSVLYIDTEQSEDDTISVKNRICTLAGLDYQQQQDRFMVARLRETNITEERYKQILQLLWEVRPTVVFIDGLLDLVEDYNKQDECSQLIRDLMSVSTYYNISMWCVLHENPMTEKLVGSLGSIAERKVTEVFVIRKHKGPHEKKFADFPQVFFEVKQTKARGKDQEDWYFTIADNEFGWGTPEELGYREQDHRRDLPFTPEQLLEWITLRQRDLEWPAGRREIERAILIPSGITDETDMKEAVKIALNRRFFLKQSKDEMDEGQKTPKLKLNEQVVKPF